MADTKVTDLAAITDIATTDILYIVDDPGGTAASKKATVQNVVDTGFWHHHILAALSDATGASGATVTPPDANTIGGWQLDAAGENLYYSCHIGPDWDGATDMIFRVVFELNAGGALATDTVDIKAIFRYKADGQTAIRTQTVEVATIVGVAAQYTQFKADFTFDWDIGGGNNVAAEDFISIDVNLETDTSEVDDIIVNMTAFKYKTDSPCMRQ